MSKNSYQELKSSFEANGFHMIKPDGINQLYQADFTHVRIPGYRVHHVLMVMDHFSRYLLTLKLYPSVSSTALVNGLENALEEAMKLSKLDLNRIIVLVTGDKPAMTAENTARYLETSPYYHILGNHSHPYTKGRMARLIRTVKEEGLYHRVYRNPQEAQKKLDEFRLEYNHERPHQALEYDTPCMVYTGKRQHILIKLKKPQEFYR